MNSRPPSTKGDGNSAAEPKARRRKRALNLSNSSRPRDPSYKIGGGSRGEGEPRVLRVYLRRICNIVFPTQSVLIRI
jgi:hypothetical protein